ncbi:hypothetical protein PMIT1312_00857 [Prochlorococcus marinus str. MIT 1312]|nr:hypothetical protein PMIT1312_00857 [Prochlorococcus marinus str. MIT 1312]
MQANSPLRLMEKRLITAMPALLTRLLPIAKPAICLAMATKPALVAAAPIQRSALTLLLRLQR